MINSKKSKDELVRELDELQKNHNSLKLLFNNIINNESYNNSNNKNNISEELIKSVFNNTINAISISKKGINILFNDRYLNLFGYNNVDDIINRSVLTQVSYKEHMKIIEYVQNISMNLNTTEFLETVSINKSGEEFPSEMKIWKYNYNNDAYTMCIIRDISDRKKIEKELEESQKLYKHIAENTSDGILVIDQDTKIKYVSPSYLKQIGYDEQEELSRDSSGIYQIVHPDDRDELFKNIYTAMKERKSELLYKYRVKHKFGHYFWREDNAKFNYDENGKYIGCYVICRDVTERVNTEIELQKAKEKAEENDRLKTTFLQNMSHEIRTPMNAIMGFSQLLPMYLDDQSKLDQYINIINQRCNDLLNIIDDILEISKIESGQLLIKETECDLITFFNELNNQFINYQKDIDKPNINLIYKSYFEKCLIVVDQMKLKHIFTNLISNSLKFTDSGSITYGCKIVNKKLVFYVSDTGIGIPMDKKDFIFERFNKLNSDPTRIYSGTVLGLSITKGLVDILNGEIKMESEINSGTTMSFIIDYKEIDIIPIKKEIKDKIVLIVEDDYYNLYYLKEILEHEKFNIMYSENGKTAINMALENDVDLILMDIRLPDMNGYDVIKEIQKIKPDIKVISQTAYATDSDKELAYQNGCVDYISKPMKGIILIDMILKYLNND